MDQGEDEDEMHTEDIENFDQDVHMEPGSQGEGKNTISTVSWEHRLLARLSLDGPGGDSFVTCSPDEVGGGPRDEDSLLSCSPPSPPLCRIGSD